jgi:hypothetical protein
MDERLTEMVQRVRPMRGSFARLMRQFRQHWEPHEMLAERRDEIARSLPWALMTRAAVVAAIDERIGLTGRGVEAMTGGHD